MADIADKGNDAADLFLSVALRNRQPAAKVAPSGACLHCAAPVEGDRRWCDSECRDAWEADRRRR